MKDFDMPQVDANPAMLPPQMVGSWALVTGECRDDATDQTVRYQEVQYSSLKVLSETHFSFITHAGQEFYFAAGGTYRCEGEHYSEQLEFASHPSMMGREFTFQFRIEGDLWHNTRWDNGVQVEHEIWRRLDSK
jgi:hypothetical protein